MKVNWSEPGMIVSGVAHAALLVAALVAFSDSTPFEDAQESIPVEVISASDLSSITRGEKTGKTATPDAKPRADKVADIAELKPPAPEVKRDVPTPPARPNEPDPVALPTPPERPKDDQAEAEAKAAEAKAAAAAAAKAAAAKAAAAAAAEAKAEAEADAREAEALRKAEAAKAEAEAKARQVAKAKADADARAKAEADARAKADAEAKKLAQEKAEKAKQEAEAKKAQEKAEEAKKLASLAADAPKPKPSSAKPESKFDPSQIEKLLTSKEQPQSAPSTGRDINRTASLGAPNATGPKLNPSQRDQLGNLIREQITTCWSPPPGLASTDNLKPRVRLSLNQDGTLSAEPALLNGSRDPAFSAMAESAVRAIKRCAPLRIPAQFVPFFSDWKELNILFDPKEMMG